MFVALGTLATVVGVIAILSVTEPDISLALLVATVVVRWPISVVAQQILFFGWLQPRLGDQGPRIAALLYAAFHLANPLLMLTVIPLGFLFAYQRKRTGSIRSGLVTHYAINVAFVIAVGSG
jgi:membrane protease YdiL (CAAX protease family)